MSRPTTKETLLSQAKSEYEKLQTTVKTLSPETIEKPGACDKWSIKDILAHLNAWHELMINWYEVGMSGEKPAIPSPGYTWKTTPALNEKIYQDNRNTSLKVVLENLDTTYKKVLELIEKHSDKELFTKKFYQWTGTTSLGAYFVSDTCSHYDWASKLIKDYVKKTSKL